MGRVPANSDVFPLQAQQIGFLNYYMEWYNVAAEAA